jgi:hypothetical protein
MRPQKSRQDFWAEGWVWTVSWMSINRIDQYPGRGSGRSCRDQKNPANVTAAVASHMITPMTRTHGVDPNDITMMPAMATASPTYPTRRAQTAILQCPLPGSSGGSSIPGIVPRLTTRGVRPPGRSDIQHWAGDRLMGRTIRECRRKRRAPWEAAGYDEAR